jgi:hypothetical protein
MTRFEKHKRDLTVEQFTKAKFRPCLGCARESVGRCTHDQCQTETIKYWNEEVDDANKP